MIAVPVIHFNPTMKPHHIRLPNHSTRAFTLIELLVVIAIIGVLSSVVTAAVRSAREKARLAAGRAAEHSALSGLGSGLLAEYLFEDCGGSTLTDGSGLSLGRLLGPVACATDTQSGNGLAQTFDGASNIVVADNGPAISDGDFTVAAWVRSTSTVVGNNNGIVYKRGTVSTSTPGFALNMPAGNFMFRIADGSSAVTVQTTTGKYNDGRWYFVAAAVQRGRDVRLYVDGRQVAVSPETTLGSTLSPYPLGIGGLSTTGSNLYHPFTGSIDQVRIYDRALASDAISRLFLDQVYGRLARP